MKVLIVDLQPSRLVLSFSLSTLTHRHTTHSPCYHCTTTDTAKFMTASFIISLEAVHEQKILHRDIKPGR